MQDKPDLAALIGSRICHDLISPIGAIGNGVELMMMDGTAKTPELALIAESVANANARIRYANGCVANTTASRVSMKMERKLRVFQDDAYISIDLQQKVLTIVRKPPAGADVPKGQVLIEERTYDQGDALKFEIEAFLRSIREGTPPVVTGEDGLRALETATKITQMVQDDARQ